jgi:prophage DNA circulation protein
MKIGNGGQTVLGRNLDDAAEWVRSWNSQAPVAAEVTAALADRVAGLAASATGRDGAVHVSVNSRGIVTELGLDDRVHRLTGADLAAEIMRTMRRAHAGLLAQVAAAVDETVGAESDTGRAVLESFAQRFPAAADEPVTPVMPASAPFPSFANKPTLPHQQPANGFESGRDSRAR